MRRPLTTVSLLLIAAALFLAALAFLVRTLSPSSWLELEKRVSRTVSEEIVRIAEVQGDRLELASVETVETFSESDSLDLGWLHLGTTTTEIRVPVVYRFHVALAEGLKVRVTRHGDLLRCVVNAPALKATLPPAIRTEGMQKRAENGWARFNAGENLAALERNLSAELVLRAPRKAELARDKARLRLAGFVERWIDKGGDWGGHSGIREVVVRFPGEKDD